MKKLLIMAMALFLITSVMAYDVDFTINSNIPLGVSSYRCAADTCTLPGLSFYEQEFGASSVEMNFDDAVPGDDPDYYALYFYPQDACHVPTNMQLGFELSGKPVANLVFYKQDAGHCGSYVKDPHLFVDDIETVCAPVSDNVVDCGSVPLGSVLKFSATIYDGWDWTLNFVPAALEDYYKSIVNVFYSVNSVVQDSEQIEITMNDGTVEKSFEYTPLSVGEYHLKISTNMDDDCKCDGGSNTKYKEAIVTVTDNEIPEFTIIGILSLLAMLGSFIYKS